LNIAANILGLGWASTPSGLAAMKDLTKLNNYSSTASDAMCNFLILNISSLQLIPVSVIAYRAQYGSANPADITAPAIIATGVSTASAMIFCKIMGCTKSPQKKLRKRRKRPFPKPFAFVNSS
jgi:spore maturation protein A